MGEKGFTLIELVVVLAIVALLLAIVLPFGLHRRGHDELASGAREIAGALRLARSRAILVNRPASFVVDVAIRFFPDGSSTGGGVALSLGGERYDILVDWLTGGVSVHAGAAAAGR